MSHIKGVITKCSFEKKYDTDVVPNIFAALAYILSFATFRVTSSAKKFLLANMKENN